MTADLSFRPKRRWFQFSLRTFFILLTVFAVWFGWAMNEAREQRKAVAWVEELEGLVLVLYAYQCHENFVPIKNAEPPGPKWVRGILGIDFMDDVVGVYLDGTQVRDLTPLAGLKNLEDLYLDAPVSDLTPLAGLKNLENLYLDAPVSDLTPLAGLKNLQDLAVSNTPVSDLMPLAGLKNLQDLELCNTLVSDLTPLAGLKNLRRLSFFHTQEVSDLTPLAGLENLQKVFYFQTQVSEEQATKLQQALPNCKVIGKYLR